MEHLMSLMEGRKKGKNEGGNVPRCKPSEGRVSRLGKTSKTSLLACFAGIKVPGSAVVLSETF